MIITKKYIKLFLLICTKYFEIILTDFIFVVFPLCLLHFKELNEIQTIISSLNKNPNFNIKCCTKIKMLFLFFSCFK